MRIWSIFRMRHADSGRHAHNVIVTSSKDQDDDGAYSRQMAPCDEMLTSGSGNERTRSSVVVELEKKDGATLGLVISGGADKCTRPKIASLRPGGIAHRSDALVVGDNIVSVNGIRTGKLKHEEIINLLKNAGDKVVLEVEYDIPASPTESAMCVCPKVIQVRLEKENGSFGFTLRGGATSEPLKSRPLTVTYVRPGGPTDREGTIRAGDRILAIDNTNVQNANHSEASAILKRIENEATFAIEYDVSVMDAVRNASGPLLVEIDKAPGTHLGLSLAASPSRDHVSTVVIESIRQASIAERCGALHVGDQLLAIDGCRVENMTPAEAAQLLKTSVGEQTRLEILPLSQMVLKRVPEARVAKAMNPTPSSGFSTMCSYRGLPKVPQRPHWRPMRPIETSPSNSSLISSSASGFVPSQQVCHTETTEVVIFADHMGFGLTIKASPANKESLIIANLEPGGAAEKTGMIQVGDRVLAVNSGSTDGASVEEVTQMLLDSMLRVTLDIEFDVAESVVPSSGTFTVKLPNKGCGLGITITSPKNRRSGDPLIISDIRKGSVAHRTGTIQPGDKLLAIETVRMDNCTVEDAMQIFQSCEDIVKLRIRKDEAFSDEPDPNTAVVYTVELIKHGGPLGITLHGSEELFDPIVISGFTEGGLAERTGALHVGDRILAVNGQSLRGKPLSEAISMLQTSGDVVTLKISKFSDNASSRMSQAERMCSEMDYPIGKYGTPLPSVDSAVESWDSSFHDVAATSSVILKNSPDPTVSGPCNSTSGELEDEEEEPSLQGVPQQTNIAETSDPIEWDATTCKSAETEWSSAMPVVESMEERDLARMLDELRAGARLMMASASATRPLKFSGRQMSDESVLLYQGSERRVGGGGGGGGHFDDQEGDIRCNTLPHNRHRRKFGSPPDGRNNTNGLETQSMGPFPIELHKVTLFKDRIYEDFGFSVSDGLVEKGVFVNRIRPGGPADVGCILRPLDRIIQVNDKRTHEFDCCLMVPLIAAAGDKIDIVISRSPFSPPVELQTSANIGGLHWIEDVEQDNCDSPQPETPIPLTKTL